MNIECTSTTGSRCSNERHKFRIGVDDREATEFASNESEFPDALTNAIVDHVAARRTGTPAAGLFLQVWTTPTAQWRNVQNPKTGGVMAVTHAIAGQPDTAAQLFLWACNSVQMARDMDVLTSGLAREASETDGHNLP